MTETRKPRIVSCPHCKAPVAFVPESRFRPFCSERCRNMDLGVWASDGYRVPGQDEPLSDEPLADS